MGGRGNFLSALKKFSARKGVNNYSNEYNMYILLRDNYKEKRKVVASKETTLTVQVLFPIYCNSSCKGLISSVKLDIFRIF